MINYFKLTIFAVLLILPVQTFAGHHDPIQTDAAGYSLYSFVDLRDRETFVQVTNTDSDVRVVHVQIFNVDDNCNENNFFDTFTPNDTHIYNMRDIQTNDGNPSGVALPDNAYGFVVISVVDSNLVIVLDKFDDYVLIGNFRILDNNGYEYRTNSHGATSSGQGNDEWTFNFSNNNGVTLSDIVFITVKDNDSFSTSDPSVEAANILDANWGFEVDIADNAENIFSCRDVIFACVDEDNPLLEELLAGGDDDDDLDDDDSSANVASFEYGINNAIPHSRGAPLLCPGNTITEGVVLFDEFRHDGDASAYFVGLNNGNGRGSMDAMWRESNVN